jgi:hypothetical protein
MVATTVQSPTRSGTLPLQSFESRPDLYPPAIRVTTRRPERSRAPIFVAPKVGPGQAGPMIVDDSGQLIWFMDLPGRELAFDFHPQTYRGKPVLTWWQGRVVSGHGVGVGIIADSSYRVIAQVQAGNGYSADLHELVLTRRGTALITIYNPVRRDLTSIGGPANGTVVDSILQEVDVRTGRVLFEWHSLGHVGFGESPWKVPRKPDDQYDYFHINSIQEQPDGNLLISARNTDAVYLIDRHTGRVLWRLGGRRSDFDLGPGAGFSGQHDALRLRDGTIAIFDNGFPPLPDRESRVIVLRLDARAHAARLVRSYEHPAAPRSHSQGSEEVLPNGNLFVGWGGGGPYFSEFTRAGRLVYDARFEPRTTTSYRAYRQPWSGHPSVPPRLAAHATGSGETTAYASWNGATDVVAWRVLAGSAPGALSPVASADRDGFETIVPFDVAARYVAVEALGSSGAVLGTSAPVRVSGR